MFEAYDKRAIIMLELIEQIFRGSKKILKTQKIPEHMKVLYRTMEIN